MQAWSKNSVFLHVGDTGDHATTCLQYFQYTRYIVNKSRTPLEWGRGYYLPGGASTRAVCGRCFVPSVRPSGRRRQEMHLDVGRIRRVEGIVPAHQRSRLGWGQNTGLSRSQSILVCGRRKRRHMRFTRGESSPPASKTRRRRRRRCRAAHDAHCDRAILTLLLLYSSKPVNATRR